MQPDDSKIEHYLTLWACPFEIFHSTPSAKQIQIFPIKVMDFLPFFLGLSKLVSGESKQLKKIQIARLDRPSKWSKNAFDLFDELSHMGQRRPGLDIGACA